MGALNVGLLRDGRLNSEMGASPLTIGDQPVSFYADLFVFVVFSFVSFSFVLFNIFIMILFVR